MLKVQDHLVYPVSSRKPGLFKRPYFKQEQKPQKKKKIKQNLKVSETLILKETKSILKNLNVVALSRCPYTSKSTKTTYF